MFEKLQEERRGSRLKERRRLLVTVAGCLAVGTAIYGAQSGCTLGSTPPPLSQATSGADAAGKKKDTAAELDRAPLLAFHDLGTVVNDFDESALDYVVRAVLEGGFSRDAWKRLTPAEVNALDPGEGIGRTIEVRGVVKNLDRETRTVVEGRDVLWSFALETEDGQRVVVIQPGKSTDLGDGRPEFLPKGSGRRLDDGLLIDAKGVYLQRRTGTIAGVVLGTPTAVLVGREYRTAIPPKPPVASLKDIDFDVVEDRFREEMRNVEGPNNPAWAVLQWAKTLGHDEIVRRLKAGELQVTGWYGNAFAQWRTEMAAEKKPSDPDRRQWIPAQRGKVFTTLGLTGEWVKEEWENIPENDRDVTQRWKLFLISHWDHWNSIRFDCPWPSSVFAGIKGYRKERLRVWGVFVQTWSYDVKGEEREGQVECPYFILLHVEPHPFPPGTPLTENPFFWTWVSLAVFGGAFFLVMSRVEKRESAAMREQNLRIRRRVREDAKGEHDEAPSPPAPPPPPPTPPDPLAPPASPDASP